MSEFRSIRFRFVTLLVLLSACLADPGPAWSQKKHSPEDLFVKKLSEKSVNALGNGWETPGQLTLGAVAIVQHFKRYEEQVPRNNPVVQKAVDQVLKDIPKDTQGSGFEKAPEIYYPCMALILLCEVDDQKYDSEIKYLIDLLKRRQKENGGYTYVSEPRVGDTSQVQYAALAMFVARQHGFYVDPEMGKAALTWLCATQQQGGVFVYHMIGTNNGGYGISKGQPKLTLSIQAAGVGTVYLLADLLQLTPRKKNMSQELSGDSDGLPPGVSIYVPPKEGENEDLNKEGPLVNFDRGVLNSCQRAGNDVLNNNFSIELPMWTYYYLYALERYAWFREQADGTIDDGRMTTWYDDGVDYIAEKQQQNGEIPKGAISLETSYVNTAFAVLFLVRSSEILVLPSGESTLKGGIGFESGTEISVSKGQIKSNNASQNLDDLMSVMNEEGMDDAQMENLTNALKTAMKEFRERGDASRGQIASFLRGMVSERNWRRRLIAVRFLASEQNLDNVPALLIALEDPKIEVANEAHNGLRLISRKIDSIKLTRQAVPPVTEESYEAVRAEYRRVKDKWTEWFLRIRPNADLLN